MLQLGSVKEVKGRCNTLVNVFVYISEKTWYFYIFGFLLWNITLYIIIGILILRILKLSHH